MRKFILMAALAAGVLTSCSQEDEFATSGTTLDSNTIAFSTHSNNVKTRAAVTLTSLDEFFVTAVNADKTQYFSNEKFVYDVKNSAFASTTAHYWPTTGTLDFFAINETGSATYDANNAPKYTYSSWAGKQDLVAATVKAGEKEIPYPLTFKHITSQISISAEAENKTEQLSYKLTAVKVTAPSTGTYSFATTTGGVGTWSINNSQTNDYSFAEALPRTFTQNGQVELSSCYWNILPATSGSLVFRIEYQVLQNGKIIADFTGDKYKECKVTSPNLQAGKRYFYNLILTRNTNDVITFTTTMADWEDGKRTSLTTPKDPTSITLSASSMSINVGQSQTLKVASSLPEGSEAKVTWSSENPSVATVDANSGVVTAVSSGTAVITATTSNGVKASCTVTCNVLQLVSVTIDQYSLENLDESILNTFSGDPIFCYDDHQEYGLFTGMGTYQLPDNCSFAVNHYDGQYLCFDTKNGVIYIFGVRG